MGLVSPDELGATLTDEHLSVSGECFYTIPSLASDLPMSHCSWTLKNVGWIQQWPYSHLNNLTLTDPEGQEAVLQSLIHFKNVGGGCIVENSTIGMNRKTSSLRELSAKSGVKIIAGTG